MTPPRTLQLELVAIDPPFEQAHGVLFGLQAGREVDDPVPAVTTTVFTTTLFITEVEVAGQRAEVDVKGEHVHGKRGDRFLYIAWGLADPAEPFVMFARAKVKLAAIPSDMLDLAMQQGVALVGKFRATNAKGEPATGTIKSADLAWYLEPEG